jgi:hypothetical protein
MRDENKTKENTQPKSKNKKKTKQTFVKRCGMSHDRCGKDTYVKGSETLFTGAQAKRRMKKYVMTFSAPIIFFHRHHHS